ncbi:hypothetical protein K525DRAFT_258748 [Schizophyllum commune Loenen D]|nr:hypothetical protein K525DRAFT_258748 [Schizophyllum commune Loenen D]
MTDLTVLVSPMPLPTPSAPAPSSPFITALKRRSLGLGLGRFGKSAAELGKHHQESSQHHHSARGSKSAVDLGLDDAATEKAAGTLDGLEERGRIDSRRCSGKGIMVTLERELDSEEDTDADADEKPAMRGRTSSSASTKPEAAPRTPSASPKNKKALRLSSPLPSPTSTKPDDPLMYPKARPHPKKIPSYDPGLLSPPPPGFRPRHRPTRSRSAPPVGEAPQSPRPGDAINPAAIGHGARQARTRMATVPAPAPCDFDAYMRGETQNYTPARRNDADDDDDTPSRYAKISNERGLTEYEKKRAFAEWERKQARRRTGEVRQIEIPDLPSIESTMSSPSDGARNRWRAATEFEIPYPRSPDMDDDTESCRSIAFSDTTFNRSSFGPGGASGPRLMQRRSLTTPCAGELVRPEPPLLRPSPFWRHTPRSGVTPLSYSPASALVRRSAFVAAGLDLAPGTKGDLRALCVDARVREKNLVAPPTGIEGVGV